MVHNLIYFLQGSCNINMQAKLIFQDVTILFTIFSLITNLPWPNFFVDTYFDIERCSNRFSLKYTSYLFSNFFQCPTENVYHFSMSSLLSLEFWNVYIYMGIIKAKTFELVLKGQIKSGWIYEDIDFPNYHLKYLKNFCPESFEVEYF